MSVPTNMSALVPTGLQTPLPWGHGVSVKKAGVRTLKNRGGFRKEAALDFFHTPTQASYIDAEYEELDHEDSSLGSFGPWALYRKVLSLKYRHSYHLDCYV